MHKKNIKKNKKKLYIGTLDQTIGFIVFQTENEFSIGCKTSDYNYANAL